MGDTASELYVMSAVSVDVWGGSIVLGTAEVWRTIHGLKSPRVPLAGPQPAWPGPALQPHQLFSRSAIRLWWTVSIATTVEMKRLKCAVTLGPAFCNTT